VAHRVGRDKALLFHDRGTRRKWVVSSTPRPHFTLGERPSTHFTGGWVGPQGRSGRAENLVPTGIRSRTVQPVVSRYTDWDTRPTIEMSTRNISRGVKAASALGWPYHLHVLIVMKSGSLSLLEPSGSVQACTGVAWPSLGGNKWSSAGPKIWHSGKEIMRMLQSRSGCFRGNKNLFPLSGIEPRFIGCSALSVFTACYSAVSEKLYGMFHWLLIYPETLTNTSGLQISSGLKSTDSVFIYFTGWALSLAADSSISLLVCPWRFVSQECFWRSLELSYNGFSMTIKNTFQALSQNCEKRPLPSSCLSVCLSVCLKKLGSHRKDLHLRSFRKYAEKIHVSLKCNTNNGYFIWKPVYIYDYNLPNSS